MRTYTYPSEGDPRREMLRICRGYRHEYGEWQILSSSKVRQKTLYFNECKRCGTAVRTDDEPSALRQQGARRRPPQTESSVPPVEFRYHAPMSMEDFTDLLGEGFHTAFRKATDAPEAHKVWQLIAEMPAAEWTAVLNFVASAFVGRGVVK